MLFKVSTNTLLQHLESPSISKSQGKLSEDEKGEKVKPGAAIEPEKEKVLNDGATKDIECVDDDDKLPTNEADDCKEEKSKFCITDDEKDMFENESENLLQDEYDQFDKNKLKKSDLSLQDDSDESDDEPIVGHARVTDADNKSTGKSILEPCKLDKVDEKKDFDDPGRVAEDYGKSVDSPDAGPTKVDRVDDNKNSDEPVAGPSGASAVNPSFNKSQSDSTSELNTISSQSLKSFLGISDVDPSFIEEQLLIAKQIEQEKKDLEIALKLQNQLNKEGKSVDRRKGTENGYSFRVATPKSAAASSKKRRRNSSDGKKSKTKDKNQMSIKDSFKRTKLCFQESEEL